jgi:hypothetical protein
VTKPSRRPKGNLRLIQSKASKASLPSAQQSGKHAAKPKQASRPRTAAHRPEATRPTATHKPCVTLTARRCRSAIEAIACGSGGTTSCAGTSCNQRSVKRSGTVDQDRRRRDGHPLGCDVEAATLEARSAAEHRKAWRLGVLKVGLDWNGGLALFLSHRRRRCKRLRARQRVGARALPA